MAFVPKLIAMVLALGLSLPWILTRLIEYSRRADREYPELVVDAYASHSAHQCDLPCRSIDERLSASIQFATFVLVLARDRRRW